ncbi:uncharacterized protein [Diadema setosum]|uniref:uncharacterized protein n=1 Tax=Diadema setosum TaxID=31175 RepID=UPI003B39FD80
MQALKPPGELLTRGNPADNWKSWKQQFSIYKIASGLGNKGKNVQVNTLLHVAGPEALRIYNTFDYAEDEDREDVDLLIKKFDGHFLPQKNITYERHIFHTRIQQPRETFDDFLTDLKQKAATCEFGNLNDSLVKDRIIIGIRDASLRTKLLEKSDLTLQQTIDACRTAEVTNAQTANLNASASTVQEVHAVKKSHRGKNSKPGKKPPQQQQTSRTFSCRKCGNKHGPRSCPAYGKTCSYCKGPNHFATVCRKKQAGVHHLTTSPNTRNPVDEAEETFHDEDDDFMMDHLSDANSSTKKKEWNIHLNMGRRRVKFKVDTGAQCNVLSEDAHNGLDSREKTSLRSSKVTLTSFSGHKIRPVGQCTLLCEYKNYSSNI